jgi:CDGSH-type Zn-finger protein
MDEIQKIQIVKNGPYIVSGGVPLKEEIAVTKGLFPETWEHNGNFPPKETYSLCRCGKTKNVPYCDNSHTASGFDGGECGKEKKMNREAVTFEGPGIIMKDISSLCSGARFCDTRGGTWHLLEKSDDPEIKKVILQQIFDCPAGRLSAEDKDTHQPIEPQFPKSISVTQDPAADVSGPLWVKGGIPIISADGSQYETRNRVTLCRCGASKNKPYCDGSHILVKYNDGQLNTDG